MTVLAVKMNIVDDLVMCFFDCKSSFFVMIEDNKSISSLAMVLFIARVRADGASKEAITYVRKAVIFN